MKTLNSIHKTLHAQNTRPWITSERLKLFRPVALQFITQVDELVQPQQLNRYLLLLYHLNKL